MAFYFNNPSLDDGEGVFFEPGISRTEEEKPQSRLQKHAPPSLQLDLVPATVFSFNTSSIPIPLLSPLILAPPQFPECEGKPADGTRHGWDDIGDENDKTVGLLAPTPTGWQHPAVPMSMEPSSLASFFQAQCVLVHHVQ